MNGYTLILCGFFAIMIACQSDPAQETQTEEPKKEESVGRKLPPKSTANAVAKPNPEEKRAWSILTVDLWHYNFALSVTETPDKNIYEGYWIDFEDDFSYTKGYYDEVVAKGYYDFDLDSKILEIIPEEGDDEPSQWTIKTNGEVIIMIGTSKFGNNATQIKLVRERERPRNI